jgi:polyisoprenoid-binding protein YceI
MFLLPLLWLVLPAGAADWRVDYGRSQVGFVIKQMNVPVEGSFRHFTANAVFDPLKPETSRFRVEVQVASIDTGSAEGNAEVMRPAWFDAARYPKALFVSDVVRRERGYYTATGDLTVKGKTQPITASFVLTPERGGGWMATGRFMLKRSDFGVGGGEWADVVGDDAEVKFKMLLRN